MLALTGLLISLGVVNDVELIVQAESSKLFLRKNNLIVRNTILSIVSVLSVSLYELSQVECLLRVDNLVSSRHGDSTIVIVVRNYNSIITNRLIEVVVTDIARASSICYRFLEVSRNTIAQFLQRSLISQCYDINSNGNDYTIVRSNDSVTLCHLSSEERQLLATAKCSSYCANCRLLIGSEHNITSNPLIEHRLQLTAVNVEGNSQDTILVSDVGFTRSSNDSTSSTSVNLSIVLEE